LLTKTNSIEHSSSSEAGSHSANKFPAFYGTRRFIMTALIFCAHFGLRGSEVKDLT